MDTNLHIVVCVSELYYLNVLSSELSFKSIQRLQLLKNAEAWLLKGMCLQKSIMSTLCKLHLLLRMA